MKKRILLATLMLVLITVTTFVFVVHAEADEITRLNSISTRLENEPLDFSEGNIPVCPYCNTQPDSWQVLGSCTEVLNLTGTTHYYLAEDLVNNTHYYSINKGANICVYLSGKDILSTRRAFYVASGGTLTIMGTADSTVCGTATDETSTRGTSVDTSGGTINLCGGTYIQSAKRNVAMLREKNSVLNIYNGTLLQGKEEYATPTVNVSAENCVLNMYGGEISGGKAAGNGGNIYSTGAGIQINISGGTVTGGTANSGGNIAASSGATVNISGDAVISDGLATGNYSRGGNIFIGGSSFLNVSGGTIRAGHSAAPDVKRGGGNVHIYRGTMTMTGGTIENGTSDFYGGNLFLCEGGIANISGGTVSGGQGTGGGNICVSVYGTTTGDGYKSRLNLSGGTVTGGSASGNETGGGNILVVGNADNTSTLPVLNLTGGTVSNGKATTYGGGNLYVSRGEWNMTDGTLFGGEAEQYGGNVFLSGSVTKANISGGTICDGYSKGRGGNVYIASLSVTFNFSGGSITGGTARTDGGNIFANNGRVSLTGGSITHGTAHQQGGNIYVGSNGTNDKLTLGNCRISDGKALGFGKDIYISSTGKLLVQDNFTGNCCIYLDAVHLTDSNKLNTDTIKCDGTFPGLLSLENMENTPVLCGIANDTALYISTAALVKGETISWFVDNAAALAAYAADTDYLQAADGILNLTGGSYTVDLAGNTVTFTGSGEVTCFDSANADFTTYGTATFAGVTLNNSFCTNIFGNNYYTAETEGIYSFHRLGLRITGAAVRPAGAGIYYTGIWQCDALLKTQIDSFGVAVSLTDMPTALDEGTLWTSYTGQSLVSGQQKTGAMVENILSETASNNDERGLMPIYAAAYVQFTDGTTAVSPERVAYSLYDLLKDLSTNINQYHTQSTAAESFMAHWRTKGLIGPLWDDLCFAVSEDVANLNTLYAGLTPYYGELHDHADTGGTSDGKQPLSVWKTEMERLNMDFATIVDHKQSSHMYLEDWDNAIFIGGSEAATTITDRTGVKLHYNMIFSDPEGLEAVVSQFPEFKWQYYPEDYTGTNAEKLAGGWHFSYPNFTAARFTEVCKAIYANGGFVSLVHPKSPDYITSDDPADAYFMDGIAMEVFYTYHTTRDGWKTAENYKLWTNMLKAGYKVYATAGNDEHRMPSDKAVSVIYAAERTADAWVNQQRCGNFVAGGVGIRAAVGDTMMGGTTEFTGKRFAFSVGDFHNSLYNPDHIYRVDVLDQNGVVFSEKITCTEVSYFAFDANTASNYYYIEVYDETTGSRIAIGNPIWNT